MRHRVLVYRLGATLPIGAVFKLTRYLTLVDFHEACRRVTNAELKT